MKSKQLNVFAITAAMTLSVMTISIPHARAATSNGEASGTATSKQESKAQKKAESKQRREKKNAELKTLEKNGYNPAGNQTNYPQNLQNAQQKAAGQKPTNAPAVAP